MASFTICRFCRHPEHVEEVRAEPICRCREAPSPELVEERARHRREIDDMTALLVRAHAELLRARAEIVELRGGLR